MDIRTVIKEAVNSNKNQISFNAGSLSSIMIDTYIRMGIKQTGKEVTYSFIEDKTTHEVVVKFNYQKKEDIKKEEPKKEMSKKEEKEPSNSSLFSKIKNKLSNVLSLKEDGKKRSKTGPFKNGKTITIHDKGNIESYLSQIDLAKSNAYFIASSSPSRAYSIIKNNPFFLSNELEGVVGIEYRLNDGGLDLIFPLGMDYEEFQDKLLKGYQKAKEVYQEITNGIKLPSDYLVLLVYCYLQKSVKYNIDYLKKINSLSSFEGQEIENAMAYGALVKHLAVCEGYSWAMIKILEYGGIKATPAYGLYEGGAHQWVKVYIGGSWYHVDPTLAYNSINYGIHGLLMSDIEAKKNHYQDDSSLRALNNKYDGNNIESFISRFQNDVDSYVLKGLPIKWKKINFDILG